MDFIQMLKQESNQTPNVIKVKSKNAIYTSNSKGDQPKWLVDGYWVKGDLQGYEGLSEYLVSVLLSFIEDVTYVPYKTVNIQDDKGSMFNGCMSPNFVRDGESFVRLTDLLRTNGHKLSLFTKGMSTTDAITKTVDYVSTMCGFDYLPCFLKTIYLDYITLNEDRHTSNLGVIECSYGVYKEAPIFDNGMAFLSRQTQWGGIPYMRAVNKLRFEPFGNKSAASLSVLSDYKLKIRYSELIPYVDCLTNDVYEDLQLKRCINYLKERLHVLEGIVWIRV